MIDIQIEKGVALPHKSSRLGQSKYPLIQMEIGDSFLVRLDGRRNWSFIYKAIEITQKKTGRKFTTRLLEDDSRRIWRVA